MTTTDANGNVTTNNCLGMIGTSAEPTPSGQLPTDPNAARGVPVIIENTHALG